MPAQIHYFTLQDETPRKEKLDWFRNNKLSDLEMERIHPDEKGNWLNITDNDFEDLLPLASKEVKGNKAGVEFDKAVFKVFSNGIVTARDEWVRDFKKDELEKKVNFLIDSYNSDVERIEGNDSAKNKIDQIDYKIKWSRAVKNDLIKGEKYVYDSNKITRSLYRPFSKDLLYFSKELNEMRNLIPHFFKNNNENKLICINGGCDKFGVLSSDVITDFALLKFGNGQTQCLPFYRYDETGNRIENITDWGLEQFINHYQTTANPPKGSKPVLSETLKYR